MESLWLEKLREIYIYKVTEEPRICGVFDVLAINHYETVIEKMELKGFRRNRKGIFYTS